MVHTGVRRGVYPCIALRFSPGRLALWRGGSRMVHGGVRALVACANPSLTLLHII